LLSRATGENGVWKRPFAELAKTLISNTRSSIPPLCGRINDADRFRPSIADEHAQAVIPSKRSDIEPTSCCHLLMEKFEVH